MEAAPALCALDYFFKVNRKKIEKDIVFVDGEHHKFKISIEEFDKLVRQVASSIESIRSISYFCSSLHDKIEWRIKHGDSNIFANFLSILLKPDKEYTDVKKAFASFCEKLQFEFLLLYGLSKDDTFL